MKEILSLIYMVLIIVVSILLFSCSDNITEQPPAVDKTFNGFESFKIAEIFANNCISSACHGGAEPVHNLSFETWSKMVKGSFGRPLSESSGGGHKLSSLLHNDGVYGGEAVIPFNAERSLLYRLIAGNIEDSSFQMPHKKEKLSEHDINTIREWINNGAKSYANEIPCSSAEDIFVCNQAGDEITVIDAENMIVKRTIDVNFNPVGVDHPDHVVRKDGYIYVSLVSAGKVLKIDLKTYQIVGTVDGLQSPGMLVFNSDSKKLFVSKSPLAAGSLTGVYEINPETMTLISEIILPTAGVPHGIAITPDDKLLIADLMNDRIYIYNTKLNDYDSDPIEMSPGQLNIHAPMHAYTSPDGKYLYVSCRNSNNVIVYDVNTRMETALINVGHHPMQMAITPDGNLIYVTIFHENKIKVLRKEGTNWNIENEISHPAFSMPWGIDLTKDGKYIVVTSSNELNTYKPRYKPKGKERISNVVFIETATNEVVKVLDVEGYASGINAR